MKRLTLILSLTPGILLAHGAHGPVPDVAHGLAHTGPIAAIVAGVGALIWLRRMRS